MQGSNLRRLSRRFYRPPAHMRLVVIFAPGPVRHMSVRAGSRIGETTDKHGRRPCGPPGLGVGRAGEPSPSRRVVGFVGRRAACSLQIA